VVDGYLRVYFADYRLNERGTGLVATGLSTARARVSDVVAAAASGNVVSWAKYHNGGWSSPALGGPSTNIRPGHAPWGPNVARHGDGATTMVAGISPREMVLSSSPNGTTGWSDEVPLFREPQRFVMYPTVVGLGDKPSVLGERFYLYYTQFEGPSVPPDWRNVTVRRRLIRCTAGMPPAQVPFVRYAGGGRHRATTLNVTDPGMAPERGGVWYLLDAKAPGTRPLYGCRSAAGGYFAAIDPHCEGGDNALSHSEGWIYADPPAAPARALYSCYFPRTDDYLVSIHATCESPNAVRKGLLGYALTTSKVAFSRFFDGSEHWETTGPVSDRYSLQRRWFLEAAPKPGTVALYGCHYSIPGGVNHFISIHPDCEGVNRLRTEGWIHTSPPDGKPSTPLYRCYRPAAYDHFLASDSSCEGMPGAVEAGLMGYAETN
jgi:hypothetical protein